MVFTTQFNFVPSFDENNRITGFIVYPVKQQMDEDNRELITVKCTEEEAEAWNLAALLSNTGTEWIADFNSKEAADNFATLLQSIYRAGVSSTKQENPDIIAITWHIDDVIEHGRQHKIIVTPDEARDILATMQSKHDATIGINWDVIDYHVGELQRAWINRDVLAEKKTVQAGTLALDYTGGMPYANWNNGNTFVVWFDGDWREANKENFIFTDPYLPKYGADFNHDEFESDLQSLDPLDRNDPIEYSIEQTSNSPENFLLQVSQSGQDVGSYNYESREDAEHDIQLAKRNFNITFTNIGTEE